MVGATFEVAVGPAFCGRSSGVRTASRVRSRQSGPALMRYPTCGGCGALREVGGCPRAAGGGSVASILLCTSSARRNSRVPRYARNVYGPAGRGTSRRGGRTTGTRPWPPAATTRRLMPRLSPPPVATAGCALRAGGRRRRPRRAQPLRGGARQECAGPPRLCIMRPFFSPRTTATASRAPRAVVYYHRSTWRRHHP